MNVKLFAVVAALSLTAGAAWAASDIIGVSSNITDLGTGPIPPGPVSGSWLVKNKEPYDGVAFDEQHDVALTSALATDANGKVGAGDTIGAGTRVDSVLVYFNSKTKTDDLVASVTFDKKILGIEYAENNAHLSPGLEASTYLERPGEDFMDCFDCGYEKANKASFTGDVLNIDTSFSDPGDYVRVILAAPEPAAWALMLVGFGGLGAAMRARRRSSTLAI